MVTGSFTPNRDSNGRFAPGAAQPPTVAVAPPVALPVADTQTGGSASAAYERFQRARQSRGAQASVLGKEGAPNMPPSLIRGSEEWHQFNERVLRNPDVPASELKAQMVAAAVHKDQTDQVGTVYMEHVAGVAHLTERTEVYHQLSGDQKRIARQAAWLHDTVEDTALTLEDLHAAGFDDEVVLAVEAVTARKGEPKPVYYERVKAAGPVAVAVKLGDLTHNNLPERRENLPGSPSNPVAPEDVGNPDVDVFTKLGRKYWLAFDAFGVTPPPHLRQFAPDAPV